MNPQFVEYRDDGYWVAGTRISLDSVVYGFHQGKTAERIAQSFPSLSLEKVYGAIAFYLANRAKIDKYLIAARAEYEDLRHAAWQADPAFYLLLIWERAMPTNGEIGSVISRCNIKARVLLLIVACPQRS